MKPGFPTIALLVLMASLTLASLFGCASSVCPTFDEVMRTGWQRHHTLWDGDTLRIMIATSCDGCTDTAYTFSAWHKYEIPKVY